MKGIEAHLCGRLSKDAEQRVTKAGKAMTVLTVIVSDADIDTWITVLAFEDLAERLAGLPKGTEIYGRGRLKAGPYQPEGGEPRVSLTLLATSVEPLVLAHPKPRKRQPAAYGDGTQRRNSYARPARGGEDFNDAL